MGSVPTRSAIRSRSEQDSLSSSSDSQKFCGGPLGGGSDGGGAEGGEKPGTAVVERVMELQFAQHLKEAQRVQGFRIANERAVQQAKLSKGRMFQKGRLSGKQESSRSSRGSSAMRSPGLVLEVALEAARARARAKERPTLKS